MSLLYHRKCHRTVTQDKTTNLRHFLYVYVYVYTHTHTHKIACTVQVQASCFCGYRLKKPAFFFAVTAIRPMPTKRTAAAPAGSASPVFGAAAGFAA